MSVGLSGNLRDFGIADVFQLIGQQRKTGVLELTNAKARVQLAFDEGAVVTASPASGRSEDGDPLADMLLRCGVLTRQRVSEAVEACRASAQTVGSIVVERGWVDAEEVARIEDLLTRDTIFLVLRWESGSFDFRAQSLEHDRDRASLLGAEQILMDGLRMVDEWQTFCHLVPVEDSVFQRVGRFESYQERRGDCAPPGAARVREAPLLADRRPAHGSPGDRSLTARHLRRHPYPRRAGGPGADQAAPPGDPVCGICARPTAPPGVSVGWRAAACRRHGGLRSVPLMLLAVGGEAPCQSSAAPVESGLETRTRAAREAHEHPARAQRHRRLPLQRRPLARRVPGPAVRRLPRRRGVGSPSGATLLFGEPGRRSLSCSPRALSRSDRQPVCGHPGTPLADERAPPPARP